MVSSFCPLFYPLLLLEEIRGHVQSYMDLKTVMQFGLTCRAFHTKSTTYVCHEVALQLLQRDACFYHHLSPAYKNDRLLMLQAIISLPMNLRTLHMKVVDPYLQVQLQLLAKHEMRSDVNQIDSRLVLMPCYFLHAYKHSYIPQEVFPLELERNHTAAISLVKARSYLSAESFARFPKALLSNPHFLCAAFKSHPQLLYSANAFSDHLFMIKAQEAYTIVQNVVPQHLALYKILYGVDENRQNIELAIEAVTNSVDNECIGRQLLLSLHQVVRSSKQFAKIYFERQLLLKCNHSNNSYAGSYAIQSRTHLAYFSEVVREDMDIVSQATQVCSENKHFSMCQNTPQSSTAALGDYESLIRGSINSQSDFLSYWECAPLSLHSSQELVLYLLQHVTFNVLQYCPDAIRNSIAIASKAPKKLEVSFGDDVKNSLETMLKIVPSHAIPSRQVRNSPDFIALCLETSTQLYTHHDEVDLKEEECVTLIAKQPRMFCLLPLKLVTKKVVMQLAQSVNSQTFDQLKSIPGLFRKDMDVIVALLNNLSLGSAVMSIIDPELLTSVIEVSKIIKRAPRLEAYLKNDQDQDFYAELVSYRLSHLTIQ